MRRMDRWSIFVFRTFVFRVRLSDYIITSSYRGTPQGYPGTLLKITIF